MEFWYTAGIPVLVERESGLTFHNSGSDRYETGLGIWKSGPGNPVKFSVS